MKYFKTLMRSRRKMHAYGGKNYYLDFSDEELQNIDFVVFWEDHGDDRITIKTKDDHFTAYEVNDNRNRFERKETGIQVYKDFNFATVEDCGNIEIYFNVDGKCIKGDDIWNLAEMTYSDNGDEFGVVTEEYDLSTINQICNCKFCGQERLNNKMKPMKVGNSFTTCYDNFKTYYICGSCYFKHFN